MIYTIKNIKQKSANILFYTFLAFILLQFNHSHIINVKFETNHNISEEENDSNSDPYLDSALNCTLNSFNHSISFQNTIDTKLVCFNITSLVSNTIQLFYYSIQFDSNQLRAPPANLA